MDIKIIDVMKDKRIDCYSIMLSMDVKQYLDIVEKAYENNGGIEGQRVALTNRSALRIRENMKEDIKKGTVLPPLVIGLTSKNMENINLWVDKINDGTLYDIDELKNILINNELSIIDGMQRTTALREISREIGSFKLNLRIELWITDSANNLIYRMLVLNTGQISWKLKKQLEVVFSHVKVELKDKIPHLDLIESNEGGRSTVAGKYQVSHLVELYLSFCTRKVDVNIGEQVAEEFAKQDIIEKSYNGDNLKYFTNIIKHLIDLDEIFSVTSKRLFGDQNARVGFIVSVATKIFGRPGSKNKNDIVERYDNINNQLTEFIKELKKMDDSEIEEFCQIEILKEIIIAYPKKEYSLYYKKAFDVLIEEEFLIDNIEDMNICWQNQ